MKISKFLIRNIIFITILLPLFTTNAFSGPATEAALLRAFVSSSPDDPVCFQNRNSVCSFDQEIIGIGQDSSKISATRQCMVDFLNQTGTFPFGELCYAMSCTMLLTASADKSGVLVDSFGDFCLFLNGDVLFTESGNIVGGTKKFQNSKGVLKIQGSIGTPNLTGIITLDLAIVTPK